VKPKSKNKSLIIGVIMVALLALTVVGFAAGALGEVLLSNLDIPDWMRVERPEPHLPGTALFYIGPFPFTNTFLATLITILVVSLIAILATRKMKMIPGRFQSAFELVIGYVLGLCEDIAGKKLGRVFFPVVCTIFLFVMFNALLALIPGYGSVVVTTVDGVHTELLRGANTDINFPLSLAIVAFVMIEYWGISRTGFFRYMGKFFVFTGFAHAFKDIFSGKIGKGLKALPMAFIEFFVGILEFLSELVRLVSFTFRLFGNMTGGEILLVMMMYLMPYVLAIPFYGLELLMAFIQALIFGGLTLTFAYIATLPPHGADEKGEAH